MAKTIFISKEGEETTELNEKVTSKGDLLVCKSFLRFEPIEFEIEETYEVVFFGSPRAVVFFKSRYEIPKNVLIACTGSKTGEILTQMGYKVDFVGKKSGEIKNLGNEFKKWCGGKKVLFPTSDISLKTIAGLLPSSQKVEVVVYKTDIQEHSIPKCDIYILTSPSNVEGFLKTNAFSEDAQIIAWGDSTSKSLNSHNIKVSLTLKTSTIQELVEVIY